MDPRRRVDPDAEILSEREAAHLLARASELDAARQRGARVAELRAAADEAGISNVAFNAALLEMRNAGQVQAPEGSRPAGRRPRRWGLTAALATLLAIGALYATRRSLPADAAPGPMVEEVLRLRCLSAEEALALLRPVLAANPNTLVTSRRDAPRVLDVRATPAEMERVRAAIAEYENSAQSSCTPQIGSPVTPPG